VFRTRDLLRKQWTGCTTGMQVDAALAILEEHRWLDGVEVGDPPSARGRIFQENNLDELTKLTQPPFRQFCQCLSRPFAKNAMGFRQFRQLASRPFLKIAHSPTS
jgi:hypothetical protein